MTTYTYPAFENDLRFVLKSDAVAYNLANVTKIELYVVGRASLVSSTNQATDPILWAKQGYATGELRLYLGTISPALPVGPCTGYISIYDAVYDLGYVWGSFEFTVVSVTHGA